MPDLKFCGLLAVLGLTGCAQPFWLGGSLPENGDQARAVATPDEQFDRQLDSLRASAPEKYEVAREVQSITDEVDPGVHRNMVDDQLRAVIEHQTRAVAPEPIDRGATTPTATPAIASAPAVARPPAAAPLATAPLATAPLATVPLATVPRSPQPQSPLPQPQYQQPQHQQPHLQAQHQQAQYLQTQYLQALSQHQQPPAPVVPAADVRALTAPPVPTLLQARAQSPPLTAEALPSPLSAPGEVSHPVEQVAAEVPATREDWLEVLPELIDSLERDPGTQGAAGSAVQQQVYLRLLYLIANRREDAAATVDGLSEKDRDFLKHALYGLMVWLDVDQRHAATRKSALALRELREAVNHLAQQSTLDVRNATFCREVISYGVFDEFKPATFRPGAPVVLYVEVENFVSEPVGGRYETELLGEYTIFDDRGDRVTSVVLKPDLQQCNNRRRDYFIAYVLTLPDNIRAGEYSLELTIEDAKGKKSNQATVMFRIR